MYIWSQFANDWLPRLELWQSVLDCSIEVSFCRCPGFKLEYSATLAQILSYLPEPATQVRLWYLAHLKPLNSEHHDRSMQFVHCPSWNEIMACWLEEISLYQITKPTSNILKYRYVPNHSLGTVWDGNSFVLVHMLCVFIYPLVMLPGII